MFDDLTAEIARLQGNNVLCAEIQQAPWGTSTTIPLPQRTRDWLVPAKPRDGPEIEFQIAAI